MLNPERVELVRLRLGLTKIGFAQLLGVERKTLQRFEADGRLSEDVFARLCSKTGYPAAFFSKPSPTMPNPDAVSFRSHRSLTSAPRDAAIAAAAIAFEIDEWVSSQFDLPSHSLIQLSSKSPVEAAMALRAHWGIGILPIDNMINVLEAHGVRVFSLVEETRHLDAYSLWKDDVPYVFLNTIKTAEHSRFDAAHELGHLVLHRHGGPSHRSAEDEANAFASAFLIPPSDLHANLPKTGNLRDIIESKKRWRVSASALNYALRKYNLISEWIYRGNYIELNKIGRSIEPNGIEIETSQVWRKILLTLWRDGITTDNIAEDLCVPSKEVMNLLFGIASAPQDPPARAKPILHAV